MPSGFAIGHALDGIFGHTDVDFFRSTFHIFVKIVEAHLAGTDTCARPVYVH